MIFILKNDRIDHVLLFNANKYYDIIIKYVK